MSSLLVVHNNVTPSSSETIDHLNGLVPVIDTGDGSAAGSANVKEELSRQKYSIIVLAGQFTDLVYIDPQWSGLLCWIVSEESHVDARALAGGAYDQVDHFFLSSTAETAKDALAARYGKEYVHTTKFDKGAKYPRRLTAPVFLSQEELEKQTDNVLRATIHALEVRNERRSLSSLYSGCKLCEQMHICRCPDTQHHDFARKVKEEIMYALSGDPQEPYRSKLFDDLLSDKPFLEIAKDIVVKYYKEYKLETHSLKLVNVNFHNIHRGGWLYIVRKLADLEFKEPVILDTYVDKTFGWSLPFYRRHAKVPYTSPWYGLIHHTFLEEEKYNLHRLFSTEEFLESLRTCNALFVFSKHLKKKILHHANALGIQHLPPIFAIPYPVDVLVPSFSAEKFESNPAPKLAQIGTYMRDMFGIYELEIDPSSPIKKAILSKTFLADYHELEEGLEETEPEHMCHSRANSMFGRSITKYVREKIRNVVTVSRLTDEEYDSFLEKNIVFLRLLDASAVNTVSECVARSTPVLVNPLPAIVEVLGTDYPFYYTSMYEANLKATDAQAIKAANTYLANLDKSGLDIQKFLNTVSGVIDM